MLYWTIFHSESACFYVKEYIYTQIKKILWNVINVYIIKKALRHIVLFLLWFSGILGLGRQDLSYVTVEIQETTHKGQSSHHVSVLDDGSFVVSSDWILKTPGKHELSESARTNTFLFCFFKCWFFFLGCSNSSSLFFLFCHFLFRRQSLQPPFLTLLHPPPLRLAALVTHPKDLCAAWPRGRPLLHPCPASRLQQCHSRGSVPGRPCHTARSHRWWAGCRVFLVVYSQGKRDKHGGREDSLPSQLWLSEQHCGK